MHLQHFGYAFALALGAVVHVTACLKSTAVNAAVAQFAYKRVGDNLERKSAERFVVVGFAYDFLVVILHVEAHHVVYVYGAGKVVANCVQQLLNTLVFVSRTAQNGIDLKFDYCFTKSLFDFVYGQIAFGEKLFHKFVVCTGNKLDKFLVSKVDLVNHIGGDFALVDLHARGVIVEKCFLGDDVYDTAECLFLADGQLNGHCVCLEAFAHHLDNVVEVCAVDVHLVDERNTRNVVLAGLVPYGFALRFYTALSAKYRHGSVQHAE